MQETTSTIAQFRWVPLAALVATACGSSGQPPKTSAFSLGTPRAITTSADVSAPYDAAPSSNGQTIYFTATGADGPGVFKAPASGGRPSVVYVGQLLVFPSALAVSDDDENLYVSDPGVESDNGVVGGVYSIALPSGTPTLIPGTSGFIAAGLAVAGAELYIGGTSPDGVPGLYSVDVAAGGSVTAVATGSTFTDPSGIAVRSPNEIYVADGGNGAARVVRVAGGKTTVIASGLAVGYPAGLALAPGEASLLVSALDPQSGGDRVLRIDLASGHVDSTSAGIDQFVDAAGLHRAAHAAVYAWADTTADGTGTVLVFGNNL